MIVLLPSQVMLGQAVTGDTQIIMKKNINLEKAIKCLFNVSVVVHCWMSTYEKETRPF